MKTFVALIVLVLSGVVARGAAQPQPLNVVATTTLVADVARQVGGDFVTVTSLLPPDTDTHAYQFTPQDVARVAQADLLLTVGAGYEGFLGQLLDNAGAVPVAVVSNGVPIYATDNAGEPEHAEATAEPPLGLLGADVDCQAGAETAGDDLHAHGECDPHVWMAPANVMIWADNIASAFAAADPANAAAYLANAEAYKTQLAALDDEIRALVATLPAERRVLVTNHAALNYFARAYGFDVVATVLPGASTGAELSPQALAALVDRVRARNVPAIFAEVTANAQLADIAAREAGVTLVTDLYTEALSSEDGPAASYIDFMRHDAQTIVNALGAGG